ncbi:MAG: ANTAR domain-containing protein [Rhodospirillaceae bacterium]|nr:ANTAR domain-containing protein [Rhodospirillaceae bacterium]
MRGTIQNFRGARALVVLYPGSDRDRLATVLRRLGLLVGEVDPSDTERLEIAGRDGFDVLVLDTDIGTGDLVPSVLAVDAPIIAVIGVEAPSRLTRAVNARVASHIVKPIRSSGIFPALFLAFNEFNRRRREREFVLRLEARVRQRRHVVKAILAVCAETGVDDEEAFRLLRRESMRRRISIEALCQEIAATTDATEAPGEAAGSYGS